MHKLSLRSAILVILNVMVGFGIFINTVKLPQIAGFLGFACYLLVAALMVPLIYCMAQVMGRHTGGFYSYAAADISPFAGFVSAWIFFTGKLASAALIIHVVVELLQQLIPLLARIPTLALDSFVIILFAGLNLLHAKVGTSLAAGFFTLKLFPILFAILAGLYLFSGATIPEAGWIWSGIPAGIPFVVYAFTGFETACSLSRSIEDDKRNAPRAIFWSFAIAVSINALYQLLFYVATNGSIAAQENYKGAFPTLLAYLLPAHPILQCQLTSVLHLALAVAALGGSYGILFSNHWNLYALAENKHLPGHDWLTRVNKYGIPVAGIFIEALLCIGYLFFTGGAQTPLQQIGALACTIAYTITILGMLKVTRSWVSWLALGSCSVFIFTCMRNFILFGANALFAYSGLVLLGLLLYFMQSKFNAPLAARSE